MIYNVEIDKFITHTAKTNNKSKINKYIKINNQLIYNSNLNRFARNIVMTNIHNYLISYINKSNIKKLDKPPYQVSLEVHVPINYGDVSRRIKNGEYYICWKEANLSYIPTWDIDNVGDIWLKAFKDALQISGAIDNDNVRYVTMNGPTVFKEIQDFNCRKLVFKIKELV